MEFKANKILTTLALLTLLSCNDVSICTGPFSKAYHTKNECIGLSRCSGVILEVSKQDAENIYQRHQCRYCK